jgi:hypothetical protein
VHKFIGKGDFQEFIMPEKQQLTVPDLGNTASGLA